MNSMEQNTPAGKGDKKREANSPLDAPTDQQKKTRHYSGSDIENENELPATAISEGAVVTDQAHILSYPLNPTDIIQIARELRVLMSGDIRADIKSAIKEAVQEATSLFKEEVQELRTENSRLHEACNTLEKRVYELEMEKDSLEQYSRRNSLRIAGIPEEEGEETDKIVLGLAADLNIELNQTEIDRSHRVGKPVPTGSAARGPAKRRCRDIIVKFVSYNARDRLFKVRRELRGLGGNKLVYINEDLTRNRSKLLYVARTLVRGKKIKSAYSSDGKIFIRDFSDTRHIIRTDSELTKYGDLGAATPNRPGTRAF